MHIRSIFQASLSEKILPADYPRALSHSRQAPPGKAKFPVNETLSAKETEAGQYHR